MYIFNVLKNTKKPTAIEPSICKIIEPEPGSIYAIAGYEKNRQIKNVKKIFMQLNLKNSYNLFIRMTIL